MLINSVVFFPTCWQLWGPALVVHLFAFCPFSGVHRWPADVGGAEHSYGWRTRTGDPTDCAVDFRSEWNFQGLGWNGGGTGSWHNTNMLIQPCILNIHIMPSYWYRDIFSVLMWFYFLQGTVLDRIDFNVEQACVKTEDGLKQLQKVNMNVCLQIWLKESFNQF